MRSRHSLDRPACALGDLARKLTDGVFDVKEVERVFGGGMLRMLSDRYDLPKDVIAALKAASLSY